MGSHLHSSLFFGPDGLVRRLIGSLHFHSTVAHDQSGTQVCKACVCASNSVILQALVTTVTMYYITTLCICRWRFAQTPERIYTQGNAEVLPDADVRDLGRLLYQKGYQVFRNGPSLYAFKGLAGRLGPIGVHASMLAIMAGVAIGGLGGFKGSVMVPQGGDFLVAQVRSHDMTDQQQCFVSKGKHASV